MRENVVVSSRGQITLPVKMRQRLGIQPGSVITVEVKNGELVLHPAAVVEIAVYSDEQIAQWNREDRLDETERTAILDRLGTPTS
jgi:AbrB family looped-hinge helix DNA binding protein